MIQHLSLTQCQKLAELGYPQRTACISYTGIVQVETEDKWIIVLTKPHETVFGDVGGLVDCPNVEELIYWLGDSLSKLEKVQDYWIATGGTGAQENSPEWLLPAFGRNENVLEALYALTLAIKENK